MLKIVKAKRVHLENVAVLWEEFMDHHTKVVPILARSISARKHLLKNLAESFGNPNWQIFVAKIDNEIVGFANVKIQKFPPVLKKLRYGYIQDVAVSKKYRRHGVGQALYKEVIKWYKQKKVKRVELLVVTGNKHAENFWKKIGFKDYMKRMAIDI